MATVLVIDDDLTVAALISDIVAFCRHTPVVETSSLDAIFKWVRDDRVSAVMTDYMMPRMDGLELLEVFRQSRPSVRRVLITAAPNEEEVRRASNEGLVQMVVAKPPAIADIRIALAWL